MPQSRPLSRLATRYLAFLDRSQSADAPGQAEDAWTDALLETLATDRPALCMDAILAALAACTTAEQAALIAAGPLERLLEANGPAIIDAIEARAPQTPRLVFALTGVWRPEQANPLLWARIDALTETTPGLDSGAPLPPCA